MPAAATARMGLQAPAGGDLASTIDNTLQTALTALDNIGAIFSQGTLASRPTSSGGTPGKVGRLYYATDTGVVYYDFGTGWMPLNTQKGKSIIPGQETRTNVAYGLMTTPDRVQNIVLPTDGLLAIAFKAIWRESVDGAARAALFIGANQLKIAAPTAPVVQEATLGAGSPNIYNGLASAANGLFSSNNATAHGGEVTTGQVVHSSSGTAGAFCLVFAAAGTYDISVQFKSSSGSLDVTERKLWVEARGYPS